MTLRIDLDKTPSENIIDLIMYSNNDDIDVSLLSEDYVLSAAECTYETGYNTALLISALETAPYYGEDTLYYNRVDITGEVIKINFWDLYETPADDRTGKIFEMVTSLRGLMPSELTLDEYIDQTELQIQSVFESLLYIGAVDVEIYTGDKPLKYVLPRRTLSGLNLPASIL